jgi:hypothetical protein
MSIDQRKRQRKLAKKQSKRKAVLSSENEFLDRIKQIEVNEHLETLLQQVSISEFIKD